MKNISQAFSSQAAESQISSKINYRKIFYVILAVAILVLLFDFSTTLADGESGTKTATDTAKALEGPKDTVCKILQGAVWFSQMISVAGLIGIGVRGLAGRMEMNQVLTIGGILVMITFAPNIVAWFSPNAYTALKVCQILDAKASG